jgi:hypothetical protein
MRPKIAPRSKKAPAGKPPADARSAQKGSTPGRRDVRESVHLVKAPRQTRRQFERTAKKKR